MKLHFEIIVGHVFCHPVPGSRDREKAELPWWRVPGHQPHAELVMQILRGAWAPCVVSGYDADCSGVNGLGWWQREKAELPWWREYVCFAYLSPNDCCKWI